MCLCFNNFIFVFVQWLLKIIEGDVWVVSLYYIKKSLNNCFNCTTKLNERPSSFSRVLGCPASPPLRVCWLVHLRWKKQTFDMVVGKYSRSKKIERCCLQQQKQTLDVTKSKKHPLTLKNTQVSWVNTN